jgi:ABC-2 type transport system permease protein
MAMRSVWVIARRDLGEIFHSKSTYLYVLPMLAMSAFYFFGLFGVVNGLQTQGASAATVDQAARSYLAGIAYVIPLLYCLYACNLTSATLPLEKSKRTLESLMATPVSIRRIWVAKSLGASLAGVAVGLGAAVIAYLIIALAEVWPRLHILVAPGGLAFLSGVVLVPLLIFGVTLLASYVQLVVTNVRIANVIYVVLLLVIWGALFVVSYYLPQRGVSINYYPLIYLGLILLLGVAAVAASHRLTKERVVLSSKG